MQHHSECGAEGIPNQAAGRHGDAARARSTADAGPVLRYADGIHNRLLTPARGSGGRSARRAWVITLSEERTLSASTCVDTVLSALLATGHAPKQSGRGWPCAVRGTGGEP